MIRATVLVLLPLMAAAPRLRAADPAKGRKLFETCAACHSIGDVNKVGPGLGQIFGRAAGIVPGFRYSRAMRRSKLTWDAATLDRYLADPQGTVPGNSMPFPGMPDGAQRQDLIAYLRTLQ